MKKIVKRTLIIVVPVFAAGFLAFLYFIPPFTAASPDSFITPERNAAPSLSGIADPAEKIIAERGKYIVMNSGCAGCHTPQGDQGPDWDRYLAGGMKVVDKGFGAVYTRNLTPDPETGLARRSFDDVQRILRTGLNTEGRIIPFFAMPWIEFSHWTPEDRYAVAVFLKDLKPVHNAIPMPDFQAVLQDTLAGEEFFAGDFSVK